MIWDDLLIRYPKVSQVGDAKDVNSAFIAFAENEINGLLADFFTVPFSSNNMTAKDLAVELAYARLGVVKISDADKIREMVYKRINRIIEGKERMVLDDGTVLGSVGDAIYSSDSNYHHTFGVGHIEDMFVDSSQIYDEDQERNT